MSDNWKKTRHDKWFKLAKEQGYRSRAAFKLVQMNKKYNFLSNCQSVVDLCAAPGGWLQVCEKFMPVGSKIIGIDILPMKPMKGVTTIMEDITSQQCRSILLKELGHKGKTDVVIHDGAPNIGGATWDADAFNQNALVLHSLRLATEFLKPKGWFVTKIFRSRDYNSVLWVLHQLFRKVDVEKPQASRGASAEIFLVCQDYLAPKKVDPKLLDATHVFSTTEETQTEKLNVLRPSKQKRNRTGYDTDGLLLYKTKSIEEFINCTEAQTFLAHLNKLTWTDNEECNGYKNHNNTDEEILHLCEDLKVLSRADFTKLLKWRKQMIKYKKQILEDEAEEEAKLHPMEAEVIVPETEEQEDERILAEIEDLERKAEKDKRSKRRKRHLARMVAVKRLVMKSEDASELMNDSDGLFKLSSIKNKAQLNQLLEGIGDELLTDNESDDDNNENDKIYGFEDMEVDMEHMYQEYREENNLPKLKRTKLGLRDEEDYSILTSKDEKKMYNPVAEYEDNKTIGKRINIDDNDNDKNYDNDEELPLVAKMKMKQNKKKEDFLSRQMFDDIDDIDDDDMNQGKSKKRSVPDYHSGTSSSEYDDDNNDNLNEDEESEDEERQAKLLEKKKLVDEILHNVGLPNTKKDMKLKGIKKEEKPLKERSLRYQKREEEIQLVAERNEFEEVPNDNDDDSDIDNVPKPISMSSNQHINDSEEEELDLSSDDESRAQTLALGTIMIRKKQREALIDDSYNRYSWGEEDLPTWFYDDERLHNTRPLPVTKEMVDHFKEKVKAINARPIKKIIEAKSRKKMQAVKRWEKLQKISEKVAATPGVDDNTKLRQMEKLFKKRDKRTIKRDKTYVISTKGGGNIETRSKTKGKGQIVKVDRRMKADKRGEARAERRKRRGNNGMKKSYKKPKHG